MAAVACGLDTMPGRGQHTLLLADAAWRLDSTLSRVAPRLTAPTPTTLQGPWCHDTSEAWGFLNLGH